MQTLTKMRLRRRTRFCPSSESHSPNEKKFQILLFKKSCDNLKTSRCIHRLSDKLVAASGESSIAVAAESVGCNSQNRQLRMCRLDNLCGSKPVHDRHLKVHEHHVKFLLRNHIDSLLPIHGTGYLIAFAQNITHQNVVTVIVFCYQYSFHISFILGLLLYLFSVLPEVCHVLKTLALGLGYKIPYKDCCKYTYHSVKSVCEPIAETVCHRYERC